MRSPARDSRSGRMSGMPPATDASKRRSTPEPSAVSKSSLPALARSSLLAVTTGFPDLSASVMSERAGSIPPITSTTMSMSGSVTTAWPSCVNRFAGRGTSRSRPGSRTATRVTSRCTPARCSISSAFSCSRRTSAEPTCPQPSRPTRTVSSCTGSAITPVSRSTLIEAREIVGRLAPDDDPSLPVAHEHHRRPGHLVVVRRHRVAVRAGHGYCEQVSDADAFGKAGVRHHEVALLAVLTRDRARERATLVDAGGQVRLVAGAVEDGPGVVAHSPIDGDVRPTARDPLDGPHPIQGDRRRRGDRAAGLDHQTRHLPDPGVREALLHGRAQRRLVLRQRHLWIGGETPRREPAAHVELFHPSAGGLLDR